MNSLTVPGGESSAYRLFADNLPARADKVALIDQGAEITYGALADEVDRLAAWLCATGVAPGDRVIVHLRKSIGEVAAMLAAWKVGAVVVNAIPNGPAASWPVSPATAAPGPPWDRALTGPAAQLLPDCVAAILVRNAPPRCRPAPPPGKRCPRGAARTRPRSRRAGDDRLHLRLHRLAYKG